jgi:uncharacterized membrane protein
MAALTVWKFDTASGAQSALDLLDLLERLQKEELIHVNDAAVVTWPVGRHHLPCEPTPKARQASATADARGS